jgi:hypothetical protein
VNDWKYTQRDPAEELAQVHYFTMKKRQGEQSIEFLITVREYVTPRDPSAPFFAQADKQTNQRTAPYTPSGWGRSLSEALSNCLDAIRRFAYEP